jgi:hypothetical protein
VYCHQEVGEAIDVIVARPERERDRWVARYMEQ